ncbi:MAG: phosphatase PAP2 family protein [Oscillospiraceae bacterium]|nr:phosphatase PAP2 family protein [Oscillospiraceae bacterium]
MSLLYSLAELRTPFVESLALFFTTLAEQTVAIALVCAVYWCIDKKSGLLVGISFLLSGLLIQGLKITFRISRPWVLDPDFEPAEGALETATGYSFPSGHTQSATSLYSSIGFLSKKKAALALCCAVFFLAGLSRMVLGVHTPLDVFVSMGLSLLISGAVVLWGTRRGDKPLGAKPCVFMALLCAALSLYSLLLWKNGTIELEYALDSLKSAGAGLGFALGVFLEERYISFKTETARLWQQPLKLLIGLGLTTALRSGMKALIPESPMSALLSHFLLIFFVIAIYPLIIKRFFAPKEA